MGTFRRNHRVPVPNAKDLADLNEWLLEGCRADESRILARHEQGVGNAMLAEQAYLRHLAQEDLDLVETSFPAVNGFDCVIVRINAYSGTVAELS